MKWLITLLLILTTAVAFTLLTLTDPGFVVLGRGAWTVETTLSVLVIVLVVGGILFYNLLRLLNALWHLPAYLWRGRSAQQQQKAQVFLLQGVFASLEGNWRTAEQTFLKVVSPNELSALHYLGAAYAASQLREPSRALDYLDEVRVNRPAEELALTLFKAKLQLQQQNFPAALQNMLQAGTLAPKHDEVLLSLLTLYLQLADWPALLELLPDLRKRKVLSPEQIQRLENRASIALIHYTLRTNPVQAATLWSQIPKAIRLRPVVLKVYIQHLMAAGEVTSAESLVREALKYHWEADLIRLYGELETTNTSQQLTNAENWLKNHDQDPMLLLTLGRLCLRNRLWGKAQQYLEASLHLAPNPLIYKMLGELWMQLEDRTKASEYYRRGLSLALENAATC
jgi:HemY protein